MRISTGYQFETLASQASAAQARLFEVQRRLSTGKRLLDPSDDPAGTRVLLSYRSLRTGLEQYDKNLQMAKGFLGFTEQGLADTADIMREGYKFALQGANSSTDQVGRIAMADEVVQLQRRLVEIANTQGSSGQFIFGGQKTDAKPYQVAGNTLVYSGDSGSLNVEISSTDTLAANSLMGQQFVNAYQQLEDLKSRLLGGDIGGLSGVSVAEMQAAMSIFNKERSAVGAKLNTVEETTSYHVRRADEFTKSISDVEDVDVAETILKYKQAESAYQAALEVASQGFGLSLVDFIRA